MLRPKRQAPLLLRRGHGTVRGSRSQEAVATVIPGASSNAEVTETSRLLSLPIPIEVLEELTGTELIRRRVQHRIEEMEVVDCSTNTGATASFPGGEPHSRNDLRT